MSMVHHHIKRLCSELVPDAVALVDAFALPDFLLRSALGNADGEVRLKGYRIGESLIFILLLYAFIGMKKKNHIIFLKYE